MPKANLFNMAGQQVGEIDLSDEPASDAGTSCPKSRLVSLLD